MALTLHSSRCMIALSMLNEKLWWKITCKNKPTWVTTCRVTLNNSHLQENARYTSRYYHTARNEAFDKHQHTTAHVNTQLFFEWFFISLFCMAKWDPTLTWHIKYDSTPLLPAKNSSFFFYWLSPDYYQILTPHPPPVLSTSTSHMWLPNVRGCAPNEGLPLPADLALEHIRIKTTLLRLKLV